MIQYILFPRNKHIEISEEYVFEIKFPRNLKNLGFLFLLINEIEFRLREVVRNCDVSVQLKSGVDIEMLPRLRCNRD